MEDKVFIEGRRSGYSPESCGETMTIKELIEFLQNHIEWGDLNENMKIYLNNDNGYTYGNIDEYSFYINEERID